MRAVAANILAGCGEVMFVIASGSRGKRRTIAFQVAGLCAVAIASLLLGGHAGAVLNAIAIVRNISFARGRDSVPSRLSFAVAQVAMTIVACSAGGWQDALWPLPLAANLSYTLLGHFDGWRFKAMNAANFALWLPYDLLLGNWASATADAANIALSASVAAREFRRQSDDGKDCGAGGNEPGGKAGRQDEEVDVAQ